MLPVKHKVIFILYNMKKSLFRAIKQDSQKIAFDPKAKVNLILFSFDGISFGVFHKLIEEGNNVIIAQLQSKKDLGDEDDEDPEAKRRRLSLYDGILDKRDAHDVLKAMKDIEHKDEWIVWFDFNCMGIMAEQVLAMGFTKGLFPTVEDTTLEKDRNKAKEIIKKHYPDLSLGEVQEFSKVTDALKFLDETDGIYVLKGNSDNDGAKTIVPQGENPDTAKLILKDALEAHTKDYEDGGFILEEKIIDGSEATPQAVFLDGELVFTDVDIENKPIGSGNVSVQTGAMQTLVIQSDFKDKINTIAFPKWVYDQAKKHVGLFIVDAGLIFKDGKAYFTEFCFQRFGYDSFFAEVTMAKSVTDFFVDLFKGKNPLKTKYGVAVRGMNLHKDGKERRVLEGISMSDPDEHTFVFECKKEEEKYVCTGGGWDLVVFTGADDDMEEAVHNAYLTADEFAFEDLYIRPEFDFLSEDYVSSIPNRLDELGDKLFDI